MLDFIEPAQSPLFVRILQKTWPVIVAVKHGRLRLRMSEDVLDAFRKLKNQPTIICPNHPSPYDPLALLITSEIVGERFMYLTARDAFGPAHSWIARCLQMIGCYSVERGKADLHAFKQSCQLLKEGKNKLVIFPEGEISYKNSFLREFESGPELIALTVAHELAHEPKQSGSNSSGSTQSASPQSEPTQTSYILPLAIRYNYSKDMRPHIARVLQNIERILKIDVESQSLPQRIKTAYDQLLNIEEEKLGTRFDPSHGLDSKLADLREHRIREIQKFAMLEFKPNTSQMRRIHLLMNAITEMLCKHPVDKTINQVAKYRYDQLKRLVAFMAVGERSFQHELTQEEAIELVRLIAQEVAPKMKVRKPDIITVGCADPLNVGEYLPKEKSERRKSVQQLKSQLERCIATRLRTLESPTIPIILKDGDEGKQRISESTKQKNHDHMLKGSHI